MSSTRKLELALAALEEITETLAQKQPPDSTARQTRPEPARPALQSTLAGFSPLPQNALFLGVARDELPILLNLRDPSPGPLLVAAEADSGKTRFLQMIAKTAILHHLADNLRFCVITNYPDEWHEFGNAPHCIGIYPTFQRKTSALITSLAAWAHDNHSNSGATLMLLDDLESLTHTEAETQQALRWLLLRGPNRQVWPIVTLNAGRSAQVEPWLDAFRTRIYGRIKNVHRAGSLVRTGETGLHVLSTGDEFQMREGRHWVRFWIPSID